MTELDYQDVGEIPVAAADGGNVPVDIWLKMEGTTWVLTAANYMPRRAAVVSPAFKATSESREVLRMLIQKHWIPIYKAAITQLKEMVPDDTGEASLYYWSEPK